MQSRPSICDTDTQADYENLTAVLIEISTAHGAGNPRF